MTKIVKSLALSVIIIVVAGLAVWKFINLLDIEPGIINSSEINHIGIDGAFKVQWNQKMDKESVNTAFSISPEVTGEISWSKNAFIFHPDSPMTLGMHYIVSFSEEAQNRFSKEVRHPIQLDYIAIENPRVSYASPQGEEVAPSSRIFILFTGKVINTLEDNKVPEITIEPRLPGALKWVNSFTLEYVPTNGRLNLSTHYQVSLSSFLSEIDNSLISEYSWEFTTNRIELLENELSAELNPVKPYALLFSQPVSLKSVLKKVTVMGDNGAEELRATHPLNSKKEKIKNIVNILPVSKHWKYDSEYTLSILKNIEAKEGNRGTNIEVEKVLNTKPFIHISGPNQDEPQSIAGDGIVTIDLEKELVLSELKSQITFNPPVEYSLEFSETIENTENKKRVILNFEELKNTNVIGLEISNKLQTANGESPLSKKITHSFKRAEPLKLREGPQQTISPTEFCLYTNNPIDTLSSIIRFIPSSSKEASLYSYRILKENKTEACWSSNHFSNYATQVNVQLIPSSPIEMDLTQLKDVYGQAMKSQGIIEVSTSRVAKEEVHLKSLNKNFYITTANIQKSPIIISSMNISELRGEICKLNARNIVTIETQSGWHDFSPSEANCISYVSFKTELKQHNWKEKISEFHIPDYISNPEEGFYYIRFKDARGHVADNLIQYTSLHVTNKKGENNLTWVTDLLSGEAANRAKVNYYNLTGSLLKTGTTNSDGIYITTPGSVAHDFVVAKFKDREALTGSYWQEDIAVWDFGLPGKWEKENYSGVVYTDRNSYTKGDTIYYKTLIRKNGKEGFQVDEKRSLFVLAYDPEGKEIYRNYHRSSNLGTSNGSFTLSEKATIGEYRIDVCLGAFKINCEGKLFQQEFLVLKQDQPSFNISITTDAEAYLNKDVIGAVIKVRDQYSIPASSKDVEWEILASQISHSESDYNFASNPSWEKCHWDCFQYQERVDIGEGQTDNLGNFILKHRIDLNKEENKMEYILRISIKAQEGSTQKTVAQKRVFVSRAEVSIGMKTNKKLLSSGEKLEGDIILISENNEPVKGGKVVIQITKDGKKVGEESKELNENGMTKYSLNVNGRGQFLVTAMVKDKKGNQVVAKEKFYRSSTLEPKKKIVELLQRQNQISIGEELIINAQTNLQNGIGLFTIERDGVIDYKVLKSKDDFPEYKFKISAQLVPNMFVSYTQIEPGKNPLFQFGQREVVIDSNKSINLTASIDRVRHNPEEEITVNLSSPQNTSVSLALFKGEAPSKENIVDKLYSRRGLGVSTGSNLVYLEQNYKDTFEATLEPTQYSFKVSNKEGLKDILLWEPNLVLDTQPQEYKITLPKEEADFTLQLIGITEDGKMGLVEKQITTRSAINLTLKNPSFLRYFDNTEISLEVENTSDKDQNLSVNLRATNLEVISDSDLIIGIPKNSVKQVAFKVQAIPNNRTQFAEVSFTVSNKELKKSISREITLYNPSQVQTKIFSGDIIKTKQLQLKLPARLNTEISSLTVSISPSLTLFLSSGLRAVFNNSEENAESIASQLWATLLFERVQERLGVDTLQPIVKYQHENMPPINLKELYKEKLLELKTEKGEWSWWPESKKSNKELTSYISYILQNTSNKQISAATVPVIYSSAMKEKAALLSLQIEEGQETQETLNWLIQNRGKPEFQNSLDQIHFLTALVHYAEQEENTELFSKIKVLVDGKQIMSHHFINAHQVKGFSRPLSALLAKKENPIHTVSFQSEGDTPLYYELLTELFSPDHEHESSGIYREHAYTDVSGQPISSNIEREQILKGNLTIVIPKEKENLKIEIQLPSNSGILKTESAEFVTSQKIEQNQITLIAEKLEPGIYTFHYFTKVAQQGEFSIPTVSIKEIYGNHNRKEL